MPTGDSELQLMMTTRQDRMFNLAVRFGNIASLQWLESHGFDRTFNSYTSAATAGHLEVLKWLHDKARRVVQRTDRTGSTFVVCMNAFTCSAAARAYRPHTHSAHCEIMTWAMTQLGCPVSWLKNEPLWPRAYKLYMAAGIAAARGGHLKALRIIRLGVTAVLFRPMSLDREVHYAVCNWPSTLCPLTLPSADSVRRETLRGHHNGKTCLFQFDTRCREAAGYRKFRWDTRCREAAGHRKIREWLMAQRGGRRLSI
jgi:hypothetical protein